MDRPLLGLYNSHICNMDNGQLAFWLRVVWRWVLRWCIIFSRGLGDNSLFFSLCGWRSGVLKRLLLFFLGGMLGGILGYLLLVLSVKLEWRLAETCRVFIGRTRTCAQLRSERTEDGIRTYCGRVDRSVNEVVELQSYSSHRLAKYARFNTTSTRLLKFRKRSTNGKERTQV